MLSSDVIATSRYYLNQLQHILSDLRSFNSSGFLAIFGYETSRGFCVELVLDIFVDQYHHRYFNDHNMHNAYRIHYEATLATEIS